MVINASKETLFNLNSPLIGGNDSIVAANNKQNEQQQK